MAYDSSLSNVASAMGAEQQIVEPDVEGDSSSESSLSEYNNIIRLIRDDLDSLKTEQRDLTMQISEIVAENERLRDELRKYMEGQTMNRSHTVRGNEDRNAFDKVSLLEMWHIALDEIEHLKMLLDSKIDERGPAASDPLIEQIRNECSQAVDLLSKELSQARTELRNLKNDLRNKTSQLNENKKIIEGHAEAMKEKEKLINDYSAKENGMAANILSLESTFKDFQEILDKRNEEISILKKKLDELVLVNDDLKKQNATLKNQKKAIQKEAKENLLTTEKAVLDKEKAVFKEQMTIKEMHNLEASIARVIELSTSRYKSEMRNMKTQYEERMLSLEEELKSLELKNNERQSLYEKAIREKQALESELQSLHNMNADGIPVSNSVFEDLCKKLTKTEHERDALQLENQTIETSLKEIHISKEQQLQHLQDETKRLKQRYKRLQEDFNQTFSDRMVLSDQSEQHRRRCSELEKELAYMKNRHQNDLSSLEQKMQQKQYSYQHHLLITEDRHKKAVAELQNLLAAQHKINNKWRDEVQGLTEKFEAKIREMLEDNVRLLQQNEELSRALQQKQISFVR